MKFPYGISNFHAIITENYFYVDRTAHIRLVEEAGKQLLFLRPRRFGKSLWLSTLENYYDVAKADEFETLFGHLAIGQDPTPRHNQYFVLKWDFSAVSPMGEAREIRDALHRYVNVCIQDFAVTYQDLLPREITIEPEDALISFQSLLTAIRQTPYRLYLLIDEYDNFANEVMMGQHAPDQARYQALLYGEGALKTLFKVIKLASSGRGLDRVFITGVSPVVLSDITSGYNVAENIYSLPEFNDLCGFREAEIADALEQIVKDCRMPAEQATEALRMMRTFYDGYCFSHMVDEFIYNPTLALYFMKNLQRECQYPREPLDINLAMDRNKIAYISQLPNGGQLILDALNGERVLSVQRLAQRFGVEDMLTAIKDRTFMASLLYYFGVLTLDGKTPYGELVLQIPNLVVRKLYVERIREMLLPDMDEEAGQKAAQALYQTGDMRPLCEFVEQRYFKVFDNRDYRWANELTIKTAFLTLLFNDLFYIIDSEPALTRDYADLVMIVRPDMRQYQLLDILIEFKYVSLSDAGLSGAEAQALSSEEVRALPSVQQKLAESQAKLIRYRRVLEATYGEALRLHTYSVVALGFDRLAWAEVNGDHA
jgi:hypothetical protein